MKIRNFALGLMTCAAFTACSNEEFVDSNAGGNELKGDAFVAVNILSASSTRALDNTVEGSNDENKVNSAMFFFFDAAGNGCVAPVKPTLDFSASSSLSKAVLVLSGAKTIPTSIVAIMNPSTEVAALTQSTSLTALRTMVAEVTAVGQFVMSNSAFAGNNQTLVDATPISAENICTTSADALNHPVNIHVERVVAKIQANFSNTRMPTETLNINGVDTPVKVQLLGWKATALNPQSNLIKAIDPTWTMPWWNDAAGYRSFWGTSRATSTYTYFDYTDIKGNTEPQYCLENTTETTTKLIFAAQLQTADGAPVDLMEWKGAKNTKENMKIVLANTTNVKQYYTKSGDEYTSLAAQYIDFTTVGTAEDTDYTVIAKLADGAPEIYTIAGSTATIASAADVNATLKALGEIKYWNGGASYFYTDIEHNGGQSVGSVGIIRNHMYLLTINSVKGIGTPVPDPDKEIIPEKPTTDDTSFIAATVEVLKWKIVSQTVDLTDK